MNQENVFVLATLCARLADLQAATEDHTSRAPGAAEQPGDTLTRAAVFQAHLARSLETVVAKVWPRRGAAHYGARQQLSLSAQNGDVEAWSLHSGKFARALRTRRRGAANTYTL